ncbi:hypothetical protein ACFRCG_06180 [Embleya sp. NPDC056575]|uniref:hypothetical protein n=1 Tax=Embleya sp. NPDC056575 TaxID=3345869 RepID=UPI0036BE693E
MAEGPTAERPAEPDFAAITSGEPIACRDAENAWRASAATRAILGEPDSATAIDCYVLALPGRRLPVRAYRPASTGDGPLYVESQAGAARAQILGSLRTALTA